MINVILIDDHNLFAEGMVSLFEEINSAHLIKTFSNPEKFFESLEQWPDVILLDINLGNKSGLEICREIKAIKQNCKIIALTMVNEFSIIRAMINAGADGYLLKNTSKQELETAIHKVLLGEIYFGKNTQKAIDFPIQIEPKIRSEISITKREREVLSFIVHENTTKEIAEKLGIAYTTVETHRKHLLIKLGARNIAGLVRIALEEKLI